MKSSREGLLFLAASFWLEVNPNTLENPVRASSLLRAFSLCRPEKTPAWEGEGPRLDPSGPGRCCQVASSHVAAAPLASRSPGEPAAESGLPLGLSLGAEGGAQPGFVQERAPSQPRLWRHWRPGCTSLGCEHRCRAQRGSTPSCQAHQGCDGQGWQCQAL